VLVVFLFTVKVGVIDPRDGLGRLFVFRVEQDAVIPGKGLPMILAIEQDIVRDSLTT
jgi:hypothetical protein